MVIKRSIWFIFLILVCCGSVQATQYDVHVFVHGTYLSGIALFSAVPTLRHQLEDKHLYLRAIKRARETETGFDASVMLQPGMVEISASILKRCRNHQLPAHQSRLAALQTICAYDTFARSPGITNKYYTFGWSGALDARYRARESKKLYVELVKIRQQLLTKSPSAHINFVLHGHSHGGNVILNLAEHEKTQKQHLFIAWTMLYGTPIQPETAAYSQSPIFGTIVSLSSNGDTIQVADRFSTAGSSKRTFSEYIAWKNTKTKSIIDATVRLNGDDRAFGHASFFYLDDIVYKMNSEFNALRPLPVIAYAPLIRTLADQAKAQTNNPQLYIDFLTLESCVIHVSDEKRGSYAHTQDLRAVLAPIRETIEQTWRPYARSGHIRDALQATRHAITLAPTTIYENYIKKACF